MLKELPVLGKDLEEVARIALAAVRSRQIFRAASEAVRRARPRHQGQGAPHRIGARPRRRAARTGHGRSFHHRALLENTRLARDIGVRGVPFYLVGDRRVLERRQRSLWPARQKRSQYPRGRLPQPPAELATQSSQRSPGASTTRLDQPQPAEARVALLADDDVVVHQDAERLRGSDDLLGHLDIGARGGRIARGVIVHEHDRRRR